MHFAMIQRQQLLSLVGVTEMSWIKYWIWFYSSSFLAFLYPLLNKLYPFTELSRVQSLVGSRKWDVFTLYHRKMDDHNARAFKYGMGRQS